MPMSSENDRLGLSKKTTDYEEATDEETKLRVKRVFTPLFLFSGSFSSFWVFDGVLFFR